MGSRSRAKLLTEKEAADIRTMAADDPDKARSLLLSTIQVKLATKHARAFSIDAIEYTTKRRRPLTHTMTLDAEFSRTGGRESLISTSRDIFLNSSIPDGIRQQHVKNMIGTGPRLQMRTADPEYNNRAEAYWNRRKDLLDVSGLTFNESLKVGEYTEIETGDYLRLKVKKGQTQFIEGDRIADPPGDKKTPGRRYVDGVELDRNGAPVAYHIWRRSRKGKSKGYQGRVKVEDAWHIRRRRRFDQVRGMPWCVSCVNDMQDLRETMESAKGKWKLANMLAVATYTDPGSFGVNNSIWGGLTEFLKTTSDGGDENAYQVRLGPGLRTFDLRPGEKVETIQDRTPGPNFEAMVLMMIRFIGLVLEMPLEIALQYFTRGSYSAHRAAFVQYFDSVKARRQEIEENHIDNLVGWVLYRAIKTGALQGPNDDVTDPTQHVWQWPGRVIVDPDKQRKGDTQGYNLRAESLGDICGRDGKDWQEVLDAHGKEVAYAMEVARRENVPVELILPAVLAPGQQPGTADEPEPDDPDNPPSEPGEEP